MLLCNSTPFYIPSDTCVALTTKIPTLWVEAAHGIFSIACTAVLYSWYSRNPQLGVSFWPVIGHRLLGNCVTLYLQFALRSQQKRHSIQRRSAVSCRTPAAKAAGVEDIKPSKAPSHGALAKAASAARASGAPTGTADDLGAVMEAAAAGGSALAVVRSAARSSAGASTGGGGGGDGSSCLSSGPSDCAPGGSLSDEVSGAFRLASLAPCSRPRYRSFVRLSTHVLKLPGYHPSQLGPGWEARLRGVMAARGLVLTAAYVREGCIELLLETEEVATGGGAGGGWGADAAAEAPDVPLSVIHQALQLPPTAAASGARVLGSLQGAFPQPESASSGGAGAAGRRLSLSLRPRVALLPPPEGPARRLTLCLEVAGLPAAADVAEGDGAGVGRGGAHAGLSGSTIAAPGPHVDVLLRSMNRYLPSHVRGTARRQEAAVNRDAGGYQENQESGAGAAGLQGAAVGGGGAGPAAVRFGLELELAAGCLGPGLLHVDLRLGGAPCCALPVLLLPAGSDALAAELGQWAEEEDQDPVGGPRMPPSDPAGELLVDLAALLYGGLAERDAAAAADLAAHLLSYAEVGGLPATLAAVRAASAAALVSAAEAVARGEGSSLPPPPPAGSSRGQRQRALEQGAARGVRSALLLAAGLVREGPEEAEAFCAVTASWTAAQAHVVQAMEFLSPLSLLLRGRWDMRLPSLLLCLLRIWVSLATAAAWPLLSRPAWRRLAVAARWPRYASCLVAKVLIRTLDVPPMRELLPYYTGPGLIALEGLLLPATCPLLPGAALALSALRLPLNAGIISRGLEGADSEAGGGSALLQLLPTRRALLLAAQVEVVALAATLACYVHLRLACWRGQERRTWEQQQRQQQASQQQGEREQQRWQGKGKGAKND